MTVESRFVLKDLPSHPPKLRSAKGWLIVEGEVERPISLSIAKLERLPKTGLTEDFKCLEGWVVKGVVWQGVRLGSVLETAGLKKSAKYVLICSGDFTTTMKLGRSLEKNSILALRKWGKKLSLNDGGPLRLVFEGHQCFESVKSVDRIVVTSEPVKGSAKNIAFARIGLKL